MKKILIFLCFIFFNTFLFSCPSKELHDSCETLITQQLFINKNNKTLTINTLNLALLLSMQGFQDKELLEKGKQIIFGINLYANNHGYKIIIENPEGDY